MRFPAVVLHVPPPKRLCVQGGDVCSSSSQLCLAQVVVVADPSDQSGDFVEKPDPLLSRWPVDRVREGAAQGKNPSQVRDEHPITRDVDDLARVDTRCLTKPRRRVEQHCAMDGKPERPLGVLLRRVVDVVNG